MITDADAKKLTYLQAVILEGLRFWPPIGLLASKIVPTGGATINGFFVPEGTNIGVSTMGIQRSKSIFGEDADEFRPERWLHIGEEDAERAREKKMRSTVDLVFASGKYTCPGRSVAMMELNKIFVEVSSSACVVLLGHKRPLNLYRCCGDMISPLSIRRGRGRLSMLEYGSRRTCGYALASVVRA